MILTHRLGFFCVLAAIPIGLLSLAERATAIGVIYDQNFAAYGGAPTDILHNTSPDVDNNGGTNKWSAYSGFKRNGVIPTAGVNLGAFLPFIPQSGNAYTLSASLTGIGPDGSSVSWLALGFAKDIPTVVESGDNRFISGTSNGRAWMLFRPNNPTSPADSPNVNHLGNASTGTASNPVWTDVTLARAEGGDIDMKIVLDTTQATWTADFFAKRPADSLYTDVSGGPLNLLAQDIKAIGFARTSGSLQGNITRFTLESTAPVLVPGDVNGDHVVNDVDFGIIRDHLFSSGARTDGDLTNDGYVDFADFRSWKTAFASAPLPASAGDFNIGEVPEPASALAAVVASVAGLLIARRRRSSAARQDH